VTRGTVVDRLDHWADVPGPEIADLGGEDDVRASLLEVSTGPHLARLVAIILDAWPRLGDAEGMAEAVLEAMVASERLLEIQDGLDHLLESPNFLPLGGDALGRAALDRAGHRATSSQAAIAAAWLACALRLELGGWTHQRLQVAVALTSGVGTDFPSFTTPLVRLVSIAYEAWRLPELREALDHLAGIPAIRQDAMQERALAELSDALAATDRDALLDGLQRARESFQVAGRED